jgi:hypothetical protein
VAPGAYPVSWRLDVALEELEPVPAAVTVHVGTSDVPARVVREGRFAQLRLKEPVVAARGDRVVLRTETTVGGGVVLDPAPARRFDPQRLELLETGDPEAIVRALVQRARDRGRSCRRGGCFRRPSSRRASRPPSTRATGSFRASGWTSSARPCGRGCRIEPGTSPLDPGIPLGELAAAGAVGAGRAPGAARRAQGRQGVRARRGARARRPGGRGRGASGAARRPRTSYASTTRASPGSSRSVGRSGASATATRFLPSSTTAGRAIVETLSADHDRRLSRRGRHLTTGRPAPARALRRRRDHPPRRRRAAAQGVAAALKATSKLPGHVAPEHALGLVELGLAARSAVPSPRSARVAAHRAAAATSTGS